jgi:hypothetical protein
MSARRGGFTVGGATQEWVTQEVALSQVRLYLARQKDDVK